jgi:hypothetical protein
VKRNSRFTLRASSAVAGLAILLGNVAQPLFADDSNAGN